MNLAQRICLALLCCVLFASGAHAQEKTNPLTQFDWPKLLLNGNPNFTPNLRCSSLNYGQPYTDTSSLPWKHYTCSASGWLPDYPAPQSVGAETQGYYAAMGDSITCGAGAFRQDGAYEYWVGKAIGHPRPLVKCLGGADNYQIDDYMLAYVPPVSSLRSSVVSLLDGTNTIGSANSSANYMALYRNNVLAQDAFLSIPLSMKTFFGYSGGYTGTWTAVPSWGSGKASSVQGSTVTFTGVGPILYGATAVTNGNTATATLTCDGTATNASLLFQPPGGVTLPTAPNGITATKAMQGFRVSLGGAATTSHSCTITDTGGTGTVDLIWVAFLPGTQIDGPRALLYGVPPMFPDNQGSGNLRTVQQSTVNQLQADGVVGALYVDVSSAFIGGQDRYSDSNPGIHPNDYSDYLIAQLGVNALANSYGVNIPMPAYIGDNNAKFGTTNYASSTTGLSNVPDDATAGGANWSDSFGALRYCTTCSHNTGVALTLGSLQTGTYNVALGEGSNPLIDGSYNTLLGAIVGYSMQHGNNNTLVGYNVENNPTSFNYVAAFGANSCSANTADGTTCLGGYSLPHQVDGTNNTAVGNDTGAQIVHSSGHVMLGANAGPQTDAFQNTISVGSGASANADFAVMLGSRQNNDSFSLKVWDWKLLNWATGEVFANLIHGQAITVGTTCPASTDWGLGTDGHLYWCNAGIWTLKL